MQWYQVLGSAVVLAAAIKGSDGSGFSLGGGEKNPGPNVRVADCASNEWDLTLVNV
jgi:hypothetical protein